MFHFNNIVANGVGMLNDSQTNEEDGGRCANNWWGNATGPYNANSNPWGTCNGANDTCDFDPWITGLAYTGDTFFADPAAVVLRTQLVNSSAPRSHLPPSGVTVAFSADGVYQGTATMDDDGAAEITVSLPGGPHDVSAIVTGGGLLGDCLAGCEATGSIRVTGVTVPSCPRRPPSTRTRGIRDSGLRCSTPSPMRQTLGRSTSVSPGGVFYYNTIKAPSASFPLTVTQTNTQNWKPMLVPPAKKSRPAYLYDADFNIVKVAKAAGGSPTYTVTFNVTGRPLEPPTTSASSTRRATWWASPRPVEQVPTPSRPRSAESIKLVATPRSM